MKLLLIFTFSEDRVIERIKRIFKIWEEREIYSSCFLKELLTLLTTPADGETKIVNKQLDFEVSISCHIYYCLLQFTS